MGCGTTGSYHALPSPTWPTLLAGRGADAWRRARGSSTGSSLLCDARQREIADHKGRLSGWRGELRANLSSFCWSLKTAWSRCETRCGESDISLSSDDTMVVCSVSHLCKGPLPLVA